MKKLLLLLLVFPLVFASCSDDDKDGKDGDNKTINTFSAAVGTDDANQETFIFTWSKIEDAYCYVVYYKAEGRTEWDESNAKMASISDGSLITSRVMAGFVKDVTYDMYIVAFRDSQSGSEIARSSTIKGIIPIVVEENPIVGTWKFTKMTTAVDVNDADLAKKIDEDARAGRESHTNSEEIYTFHQDGTYDYKFTSDQVSDDIYSGTYKIEGENIYFTYVDGGESMTENYTYTLDGNTFQTMYDQTAYYKSHYDNIEENIVVTEVLEVCHYQKQ